MLCWLCLEGMNSGVLLLRNTDWNRDLFLQMAAYGTTPMDIAKEEVSHSFISLPEHCHTQCHLCSQRPSPVMWTIKII